MRGLIAVLFAAAIVGFATLGHALTHKLPADVQHLPVNEVNQRLCENHPFAMGWVSQVIVYADDPATLHIQCGDGAWITADR